MANKKRKELRSLVNYDLFMPVPVREQLPSIDELYARFRFFNVHYFAGRLPMPGIRYSKRLLAAGLYVRDRSEIVISEKYHQLFPNEIDDTLKHEMIHIIHFHHNADFKREADRIGASYRAKTHPELRLPPRYIYHCPKCNTEYPRRKRIRTASCGKCSRGKFNSRFKLKLKSSFKR